MLSARSSKNSKYPLTRNKQHCSLTSQNKNWLFQKGLFLYKPYNGSLGIAPTRNCIHILRIRFVVAGGGFYSYYIHQGNKLDNETKIVRKRIGAIPCGCNSTSTLIIPIKIQVTNNAI